MDEINIKKNLYVIQVYLLEYLRIIKKDSIINNALGKDNDYNLKKIRDVRELISWLERMLKE